MSKWTIIGVSAALMLLGVAIIVFGTRWREAGDPQAKGSPEGEKGNAVGAASGSAASKAPPKDPRVACNECEQRECADRRGYCDTFSGAKRDACTALVECVRKSNCHSRLTVDCYCGKADAVECLTPGGANGACKQQIEAGLETTEPRAIMSNLLDPKTPGGGAMALMYCDSEACKKSCLPYYR